MCYYIEKWMVCVQYVQSELWYLEEAGLTWRRGPRKGAQGCGLDCDQLFATKWSQKQTIPNPSLISVIGRPIDRAEKTTHGCGLCPASRCLLRVWKNWQNANFAHYIVRTMRCWVVDSLIDSKLNKSTFDGLSIHFRFDLFRRSTVNQ